MKKRQFSALLSMICVMIANQAAQAKGFVIPVDTGGRRPPLSELRHETSNFTVGQPQTPAESLVNASTQMRPIGYTYEVATLKVRNTSDRRIVADLEWNTESGSVRTEGVVIFAKSTTTLKKTMNIATGERLSMRVLRAKFED